MECFPYFLALSIFVDICLPFLFLLAGLLISSVTLPKFHVQSLFNLCCYRQLVLHQLKPNNSFPYPFKGHQFPAKLNTAYGEVARMQIDCRRTKFRQFGSCFSAFIVSKSLLMYFINQNIIL